MKNDHIRYLMEQYIAGKLSEDESVELGRLIKNMPDNDLYRYIKTIWADFIPEKFVSDDISGKLIAQITNRPPRKSFAIRPVIRTISVAASIAVILSVGLFFLLDKRSRATEYSVVVTSEPVHATQSVGYIRNITLPDGSKVVLKAGSTLDYPEQFSGNKREVTLSGEAYFDVVHNDRQTFVIHTDEITTTVLGTAFNIKAWPNDHNVIVSVTRGRVKVEDRNKVLAVLTPDKEFDYNNFKESGRAEHKVNAEKIVTGWTKEDVDFNGETLETIAGVLSKRFGVNINIADQELADTQFVLSFNGTESIETILDIICTVNNTSYSIQGSEVYISGRDQLNN